MSSDGWVADQESSRAHQHLRKRSMHAAKLTEGGGSSQVPPDMEESWQQIKMARRRIRPRRVPRVVLWLLENILHYLFQLVERLDDIGMMRPLVRPKIKELRRQCEDEAMKWVLDSGAWIHHTSNLDLLLDSGGFKFQDEIDNKDATTSWSGDHDAPHVHVHGRGCVRTKWFEFPGVRYVAGDDTRNVVSVSQLARDHGLVTVFEPMSCHVKDKKTGQIVGTGRLCNGMYMLDSLRIVVGQIGDGGGSGGDRLDGDGGSRGHQGQGNGEGDSTTERPGGGAETRGRNQEEGSGSGATRRNANEINEEESDEKEIQEMDENDQDEIKETGETNDNGEKEQDEKKGGENVGKSSRPHTGLFGMSPLACILWIVYILCIAACIFIPFTSWGVVAKKKYTSWGARLTILSMDFHSLAGFWVLFILGLQLLITCIWQSTICKLKMIGSLFRGASGDGESNKEEKTWGAYLRELSHQEYNKRLFGLSRFDGTTDPTGHRRRHLPARAFATSTTNAARRPEDFFVDSGASYHTTWKESILFPYPPHLQKHTKPPTRSLGGIAAGSIAVKKSGYLNGNNIMLDGVLLAPEAQANLVSVGQLSIYYGVQVEMDDQGVVIKKKQNGVQIGGGRMLNNLYVLDRFHPGGLIAHYWTRNP